MKTETLYVHRPLMNGDEFISWAKDQGFKEITSAKELHVTIAFSKQEVDWDQFTVRTHIIRNEQNVDKRSVKPLGDKGAVVLKFESPELQHRWKEFVDGGCSWDWDSYQPHITITYDGSGLDLDKVNPYNGPLVLGPEKFEKLDPDWKPKNTES